MRPLHKLTKILAQMGLLAALVPATASGIELREAELVAGGSPVLQNGLGTLRLEGPRLGRLAPVVLPELPGALSHLGSGIGILAVLAGRRRQRTASRTKSGVELVELKMLKWIEAES